MKTSCQFYCLVYDDMKTIMHIFGPVQIIAIIISIISSSSSSSSSNTISLISLIVFVTTLKEGITP